MTPRQKALVQQSWRQVLPIADTAASQFYDRLFEIDPAVRALFGKTDLGEQRRKLMGVLALAVQGLDDLDALAPVVRDLGARHGGYGVRDAHYDTVGAALLWTLERGLGDAWTTETAAAWGEAYALLSGIMRAAGAVSSKAA